MTDEAPDVAASELLRRVTDGLDAGEDRPGQRQMADLVARGLRDGRHVVVQAGTGTGKTLAYLVPAIASGKRTVVVTATKALQDQLRDQDLPFVSDRLASLGVDPPEWAVLKGRSNYLCLQRLQEVTDADRATLDLDGVTEVTRAEVRRLAQWALESDTGDQADLEDPVSDAAWRAVSVGSDECPGANRCPSGGACFAERARHRAAAADLIVVNAHLYGLDVATDGAILPAHEVVVFDEAHTVEDVMSDTVGVVLAPTRFQQLWAAVGRIVADATFLAQLGEVPGVLRLALEPHVGQRIGPPLPERVLDVLGDALELTTRTTTVLAGLDTAEGEPTQRKLRAQTLAARLLADIDTATSAGPDSVAFVSGRAEAPRLELAPLDVGPVLADHVWGDRIGVLTSATIPSSLVERLGLPDDRTDAADVGSPFDYESHALLYCALHLPDPRDPGFRAATHDELTALILAAGGRTLALFTSWAAMDEAAAVVAERVPHRVLTQRELPKRALVRAFRDDESTCLFATAGFFQGVDVPGRTLSLVVLDRIPFPRPDDPLLSARRERLGSRAFAAIDVPRAATLLAQATGRLIRTADDRGVVAVLDRRLGTANYRWDLVRALPPMRRTRDRTEVESFLGSILDPTTR